LLLLSVVGGIDAVTSEIGVAVFYLLPVVFAAWFISRWSGWVTAALSAVLWLYFDVTTGRPYANPAAPWWNMLVHFGFFAITLFLVDRLRLGQARERELALTDPLTGIANTRGFRERAEPLLAQARRHAAPVTLAYIDLDRFKAVNDALGHAEGDEVLRPVAAVLRGRLRASDLYARIGGDEFVVLLSDAGQAEAAPVLGELSDALKGATERWPVDQTIGAVVFQRAPDHLDDMLRAADALMYEGKREGRGRVLVRETEDSPGEA
jgi:diguanylate cyclase (GGDEF)-like protein